MKPCSLSACTWILGPLYLMIFSTAVDVYRIVIIKDLIGAEKTF